LEWLGRGGGGGENQRSVNVGAAPNGDPEKNLESKGKGSGGSAAGGHAEKKKGQPSMDLPKTSLAETSLMQEWMGLRGAMERVEDSAGGHLRRLWLLYT